MPVKITRAVVPAGAVLVATAAPALAYLDPGTASIILQGIIGGSVAAASVVALYWRRFLSFFVATEKDT